MAKSCDVTPQFTDWGNVPEFKKLVWASNAPSGLNYLDYGAYVPDGNDPNTTPALGTRMVTNTEPCYKFFLNTANGDPSMYVAPNPDAKGLRTDCRYGSALIDGEIVSGDNGSLFTQDNFPYDQCTLDTTVRGGCPVDSSTTDGVSCLQKCKVGTEHDSKGNVTSDGSTIRFKLGNDRIHKTSKGSEGTSYQPWTYNTPKNANFGVGVGGPKNLFQGRMCTYLDTSSVGYYASTLDFSSNEKGRSPTLLTGTTSLCGGKRALYQSEVGFVSGSPTYLDEDNAMRCCQAPSQSINDPSWQDVCKGTVFDTLTTSNNGLPTASGACDVLFQKYCMQHWGDPNGCPNGKLCDGFIHQPSSINAISDTLYNYFTSNFRSGPPGTYKGYGSSSPQDMYANPQDYVSYSMRNDLVLSADGLTPTGSVSQKYYDYHSCPMTRPTTCEVSGQGYQVPDPCCRDDSVDPFFRAGIPQMCGTQPTACSQILPSACAQFTRDQLMNDPTLAAMCGCYLVNCDSGNCAAPSNPPRPGLDGSQIPTWQMLGISQTKSPYYNDSVVGTAACDPVCIGALVQNPTFGTRDCGSTCVMDNVSINAINTSIKGGVSFSQMCGENSSCYISNVTVNSINSEIGQGGIDISQSCGKGCYVYDQGQTPGQATCVSCSDLKTPCPTGDTDTGTPTTPTSPTSPTSPPTSNTGTNNTGSGGTNNSTDTSTSKGSIGSWFKKHASFLLTLFLVIVAIVLISYVTKSSESSNPDVIGDMPDMGGSDGYYAM